MCPLFLWSDVIFSCTVQPDEHTVPCCLYWGISKLRTRLHTARVLDVCQHLTHTPRSDKKVPFRVQVYLLLKQPRAHYFIHAVCCDHAAFFPRHNKAWAMRVQEHGFRRTTGFTGYDTGDIVRTTHCIVSPCIDTSVNLLFNTTPEQNIQLLQFPNTRFFEATVSAPKTSIYGRLSKLMGRGTVSTSTTSSQHSISVKPTPFRRTVLSGIAPEDSANLSAI